MTTTAVRVALRVRPPLSSFCDDNQLDSFVLDGSRIQIGNDSFTFDHCYASQSTQEQVYNTTVGPLVTRFIEGENVTMLAYGQHGTGKTYTMGTAGSLEPLSLPADQGIIPRFASSLFERLMKESGKSLGKRSFQVYVCFLEVDNQDIITDLLAASPEDIYESHHPCNIRSTKNTASSAIHWADIKKDKVESVTELLGCLKKRGSHQQYEQLGSATRTSHSHAIFTIILKQQITNDNDDDLLLNSSSSMTMGNSAAELDLAYLPTNTTVDVQQQIISRFHFVDLAAAAVEGSKLNYNTNNTLDDNQQNDGSFALEDVVLALAADSSAKKKDAFYFKNSALVRLLHDSSLEEGRNSHMLMLACVSPSASDYVETLNTLKYAIHVRNIQNRVINSNKQEEKEDLHDLRTQISCMTVENEIKMLRQEMDSIKLFSKQIVNELAQAQSERDTLRLKLELGGNKAIAAANELIVESHPLIQQYAQELFTLKLQVAETQSKLDASILHKPLGREHRKTSGPPQLEVPSSLGHLDGNCDKKNLLVESSHSKKFPHHLSASSSRKLNNTKKKPMIQRMKTTQSTSLSRKQKPHHQNMDELLELLRKEYLLEEQERSRYNKGFFLEAAHEEIVEKSKSAAAAAKEKEKAGETDGHHASHAITSSQHDKQEEAELSSSLIYKSFFQNNNNNHQQNLKTMPPLGFTPPPILDEDELESLSVPSWSDAPPPTVAAAAKSIHGSSDNSSATKRKSISLDSMWDDTDSSITTSRVPSTGTTHGAATSNDSNKPISSSSSGHNNNKDMKRQSRNLLKMLHQIQADLLVKRELVGQLEKSEDQYTQMRVNYEERLNELKQHLLEIQQQRDAAIKGMALVPSTPLITSTKAASVIRPQSALQLRENRQAQEVRSQYEVKIKRLISENQELRKKNAQTTQSIQTARIKAEDIIGRLRADIEALKLEKKQLVKSLKVESDRAREIVTGLEREIQQVKRREMNGLDVKKKLEEVNETTNNALKKRTEECAVVNTQMRQLTNVLRRAANEGTFLNEASLERLLSEAASTTSSGSITSSQKNIRRRSTIGAPAAPSPL